MAASTPTQATSTKKRPAGDETEQPRPAKRIRLFLKKPPKSPAPARTITVSKMRTPEMQPWLQDRSYDNSALLHHRITIGTKTSSPTHDDDDDIKGCNRRVETVLKHRVLPASEEEMPALRKKEMELEHFVKKIARECFSSREEKIQRDALRVLIGWFGRSKEGEGEDE